MSEKKYLCFIHSWCKRCRLCANVCPKSVIEYDDKGYPFPARIEDCIQCGMCVNICPDFAIIGVVKEKERLVKEKFIKADTILVEGESK